VIEVVVCPVEVVVLVTTSSICKLLIETFRLTEPDVTCNCPEKGELAGVDTSIGITRELELQVELPTLTTTCPFPAIDPEGFVEDAENLVREKVTVDPEMG
jgi:hypothetical protein